MKEIRDYSKKPLIFFGDFNEILFEGEKEGGRSRGENQMKAFRDVVDKCGLKDLGLENELFTWKMGHKRERLDRFLADVNWCSKFSNTKVLSYARYHSDHAALLLKIEPRKWISNVERPFKLEPLWFSEEDCKRIIANA